MTNGSIYDRIGVRTIINGRGPTTSVGGSLIPSEVLAAMADASTRFVDLEELNRAVGKRIAEVTGAEAGLVVCGSAAGMVLAAAACVAGSDPGRSPPFPIAAASPTRSSFTVPIASSTTACIALAAAAWCLSAPGSRPIRPSWNKPSPTAPPRSRSTTRNTTVQALFPSSRWSKSRMRAVFPIIVDAASTVPPVSHLRVWIERGADLVIYSGGKGIRGPRNRRLLAGRADLIEAARANGSPHAALVAA